MIASVTLRKGLLLAIAATGLAACGADMDDLDSYINEVKARPGGRIEPLPEIAPSLAGVPTSSPSRRDRKARRPLAMGFGAAIVNESARCAVLRMRSGLVG